MNRAHADPRTTGYKLDFAIRRSDCIPQGLLADTEPWQTATRTRLSGGADGILECQWPRIWVEKKLLTTAVSDPRIGSPGQPPASRSIVETSDWSVSGDHSSSTSPNVLRRAPFASRSRSQLGPKWADRRLVAPQAVNFEFFFFFFYDFFLVFFVPFPGSTCHEPDGITASNILAKNDRCGSTAKLARASVAMRRLQRGRFCPPLIPIRDSALLSRSSTIGI